MFKYLRCFALAALIMCFNGIIKADTETFRVKYMGSADGSGVKITPSTIPFGTENVKMLFGNLYTTGDVWTNFERTIGGTTVHTVNCSSDSNPLLANGERPYGKVPAKGCYYQFTPLKNGNLSVKLVIKDDKDRSLYIIDENASPVSSASCVLEDGTPLPYDGNNAFTLVLNNKPDYRLINCSFSVTAGTTYYVYMGASRPGFAGYDFIPEGARERFTVDENEKIDLTKTYDSENITLELGKDEAGIEKWVINTFIENTPSFRLNIDAKFTTGNIPNSGCYTKYTAKKNGKLVVRIVTKTRAGKGFAIVGSDGKSVPAVCMVDGVSRINGNADGTFNLPDDNIYHLTTCQFDVESGKDYYVYGKGTKLGYAGYDFILAGTAESLVVEKGKTPGRNYQTLTRAEEKEAEKNGSLPALSPAPALFITLGNGIWAGPASIKDEHGPNSDGSEYVLQSHFAYEIIPDLNSIPTDGRAAVDYVFDGKTNKSLPVTGAFYTITAMKDGTVYLFFDKTDKTKFGQLWITDAKGNPVEEYPNGIYDSRAEGGIALENSTQSFMFHAKAGTTYYVFNSQREWTEGTTTNIYKDPSRIRLAGVIYSDGETNITDTYFYNIMRGNMHEVGDKIKTPGMVMTFGGQDKTHNIYTMAKQDKCFIGYGENPDVELHFGYATAGNINPGDELSNTSTEQMNQFKPDTNTHSLPYYGTFYKFEPQCSGELTIHVLQNGGLDLDDNGNPSSDVTGKKTFKVRPLYIADEKGNIVEVKEVRVNGSLKFVHNASGYDFTNYTNYALFKDAWEKASAVGDNFEVSRTADGKGYLLINKAYCKYILDVKPGKTYFIFANASKLGFCGYKFIPAGVTPQTQSLDDTSTAEPLFTENQDVAVTYNRSFTKDAWMPVTLPYSMTETQVENTFGKGTMVIYFDGIDGKTIKFKKHSYQMIVAGRPCFVKPTESGSVFAPDGAAVEQTMLINGKEITFKPSLAYVTIDGATIEPGINGKVNGTLNGKFNFTLTPSYKKMEKELKTNDYYFGGDGKLYRTKDGENWDVKGYRSFFKCSDNTPGVQAIIGAVDMGEEGGTTAIEGIEAGNTEVDNANVVIYDLSGRKVQTGTEGLKDLVKGVYIVNGKKVTVK